MLEATPLLEVEMPEPNSIATGRASRQETACRAGRDNSVVHYIHDQGGSCVRKNGWRRDGSIGGHFREVGPAPGQLKPGERCLESADSSKLLVNQCCYPFYNYAEHTYQKVNSDVKEIKRLRHVKS